MTAPNEMAVHFDEIAAASARIASTRSRLQKKRFIVDLLSRVPEDEIAAAVGWLVEEPLCGPLGIGPAQLWELSRTPVPERPSVTLRDVEATLELAQGGSREENLARVTGLFERLTEPERALFVGALTGSLRQGSLGGVMLLALADLSATDEREVRRAVMVTGSIARATQALLGPDHETSPLTSIVLFRPLAPMLAASAESLEEALAGITDPLVEWKIDGVRAQVHKKGTALAVYSRQGNDITAGCAPLIGALSSLDADATVLDGEVFLVGPDGTPRPFQDSFSAIASKGAAREGDRLRVLFFDCLYRDGIELLDEPLSRRIDALRAIAPADLRMPNVRPTSPDEAKRFYTEALAGGHEGVMVKDLALRYGLGARGRAWQKVKEFTTADLVVLAAEWGSGRRKGFLSNLHLGARTEGVAGTGGGTTDAVGDATFCMVGKTFKGLTDAMLRWQTKRLEELATERTGHVVHVRPELVVEIRFNDVQRSRRYPGGIALRFARVVRHREDKPASEIETLASLVARLPGELADAAPLRMPRKARPHKKKEKKQLSLFEE